MRQAWLVRLAALAGATVAALSVAASAWAQGIDQTCELTATRFDADTVNVLFPDSSAQYWSTRNAAVPGTRIGISGIFPNYRYPSWMVYDQTLRPLAKTSYFELQHDQGASTTFLTRPD